MTKAEEFVETFRAATDKDLNEEIMTFNFNPGWILRRITPYIDQNGKARVCFNFEVRLPEGE